MNLVSKLGILIGNIVGYSVMVGMLLPLILLLLVGAVIFIPLMVIFGIIIVVGNLASSLITK